MSALASKISKPGIYDLPADVYHGDCCIGPSLSASGAVEIVEYCPRRFWHGSYLNPARPIGKTSKELDFGSALHVAVLEPHLFGEKVRVIIADDFRTKDARLARDQAREEGRIPLLAAEAERISQITSELANYPLTRNAFVGGKAETSFIWQDGETGIWCKTRPDITDQAGRWIIDHKTTTCAHPRRFERIAYDLGYHQKAAWQLDGIEAVTGERPRQFWYVVQERDPPYLVTVCELDERAIEWGRIQNRRARHLFADCLARGEWPGYRHPATPHQDLPFTVGLPGYAEFQLVERDEMGEYQVHSLAADKRRLLQIAADWQAPLE